VDASRWRKVAALVDALGKAGEELATQLQDVLVANLRLGAPTQVVWTTETPGRLVHVASDASDAVLSTAGELLDEAADTGPSDAVTVARLALSAAAMRRGLSFSAVSTEDVLTAVRTGGNRTHDAIVDWLSTSPAPEDLLSVLAATPHHGGVHKAVATWAQRLPAGSDIYLAAVDNEAIATGWLQALAIAPLDRTGALTALSQRMAAAGNQPARERLKSAVFALSPDGYPELHAVAEIAIHLLSNDPKVVKSDVAADLAGLLIGQHYGLKGQLFGAAAQAVAEGKVGKAASKKLEQALGTAKKRGLIRFFSG
jgi:hypothetical protein